MTQRSEPITINDDGTLTAVAMRPVTSGFFGLVDGSHVDRSGVRIRRRAVVVDAWRVGSAETRDGAFRLAHLVFGATALALSAIGLYGVIAYAAAQRRGELATRIAVGATGRQVFWLMMNSGHRLTASGVVLGLFLAYTAGRIVSGSVFARRACRSARVVDGRNAGRRGRVDRDDDPRRQGQPSGSG